MGRNKRRENIADNDIFGQPSFSNQQMDDAIFADDTSPDAILSQLPAEGFKRTLEAHNGRIERGDFVLTMTGLEYQSEAPLEKQDWEEIGAWLNQLRDSTQWMIGDWVNMGLNYADEWMPPALKAELEVKDNDAPEGKYKWMAGLVDLSYSTLRNIAYVASNVPVSRRRDTLTFSHHAEIAHLEEADQTHFLDIAEPDENDGKRLPVRKLRDLVQAQYPPQLLTGKKNKAKPPKDAREALVAIGLEFLRKPPKRNADNKKTARKIAELYRQLALQLEEYADQND